VRKWAGSLNSSAFVFGHNDTRDFIGCGGSVNREAVVRASPKSLDEVEFDAGEGSAYLVHRAAYCQ
jgi:hypothetical protein